MGDGRRLREGGRVRKGRWSGGKFEREMTGDLQMGEGDLERGVGRKCLQGIGKETLRGLREGRGRLERGEEDLRGRGRLERGEGDLRSERGEADLRGERET